MKKPFIITFLLISMFIYNTTFSNRNEFIVENIDSLINESNAVILSEYITFEITDETSAEYSKLTKILIKNKNGDKYCRVVVRESEFVIIDDIEAVIKDTSGNIIKELDSDDIKEAEASLGSFYTGKLYNWFELSHHTYPYIIEYTIKKEYKTLFFWPDWYPQHNIPTISSVYKLINEENIDFSFYNVGADIEPEITQIDSDKIYTWKLNNIPKVKIEDYMPPENKFQIGVLFKSKFYNLDDYNGSSESWDHIAKFYYKLAEGRYELPEDAKTEINSLIVGINDDREKVRILYKYLQKKNRYVAIEFGINGWQPHSASDVYKNRYGDCKDLSTYMVAILKQAGINAYPALALTRGKGSVYKDFPSSQFNHCITMVPLKDTIWLECTSSYLNMDDTPSSIEAISALVVKENGGIIIKTSQKSSYQNVSKSVIKGKLLTNGNLEFNTIINATGNQKNFLKPNFIIKSKKDDIIFLKNILNNNFSNVIINQYNINDCIDSTEQYEIDVDGVYNKFTSTRGKRIFINPAIYNRETPNDLPEQEISERKYPIYYKYPFLDIDSVDINLPKNYFIESKPKNKSIEYPFATYKSKYFFENNSLKYSRRFEIKKNLIQQEDYEQYMIFLNFVIKADKASFVLKKK